MSSVQMEERCPGAAVRGAAELRGYRFLINQRGVATIKADPGKSLFGVLWEITEAHEVELDRREGVAQRCYDRITIEVITASDRGVKAQAYWDPRDEPGSPREGYLSHILEGAREHGLPERYRSELELWARDSACG